LNWFVRTAYKLKIWQRLVIAIWLMIALAWTGMVAWASRVQRDTAIEQAKDFAQSVHQMTLAGLTGMMITGTGAQRAVFLDQIRQSDNVKRLRVVRGDAVMRQFGAGLAQEAASDPLEHQVLSGGRPVVEIQHDGTREILKAVLPAVAQRNYLGKNCLGCHDVSEGTVLGAVGIEIYLDKMNAAVSAFRLNVIGTAVVISIPLMLLIYFSLSRWVTRPLSVMTQGLVKIAEGETDLSRRLKVQGKDEIAEACAAFNRVMEKAHHMLEAERIAADVFDHALEGILVCDRDGRIVKTNRAFTLITGYTQEEALGRNPRMLQSGRHDPDFYRVFWEALAARGQWRGEIFNRRKNGEIYPELLNVSSVRNGRGEVEYYIAIFSDITERKRHEAIITHQAHHDGLTGLPNRTLFMDRLEQALVAARRHGDRPLAVMFLDLDHFKSINDSLGHDAGDRLLKEVAWRLRACVREADTVARLGGDEFILLLPELVEEEAAEAVAAKMLAATLEPYRIAGKDLTVTASIGVCLYPRDGREGETLIKKADTAMYRAKQQGRAAYGFYGEEPPAQAARRMTARMRLAQRIRAS
jgi:diguanylate cyclase (GGDEF)-like protein/PAS domain S-box-containing protein